MSKLTDKQKHGIDIAREILTACQRLNELDDELTELAFEHDADEDPEGESLDYALDWIAYQAGFTMSELRNLPLDLLPGLHASREDERWLHESPFGSELRSSKPTAETFAFEVACSGARLRVVPRSSLSHRSRAPRRLLRLAGYPARKMPQSIRRGYDTMSIRVQL